MERIEVDDVSAFRSRTRRFELIVGGADRTAENMSFAVHEALAWIAHASEMARQQVASAEQRLVEAEDSLSSCLAQSSDDDGDLPSCDLEYASVTDARAELNRCREVMRTVDVLQTRLDQIVSSVMPALRSLKSSAQAAVSEGAPYLNDQSNRFSQILRPERP